MNSSMKKMWGRALPAMLVVAAIAVVSALALNLAPSVLRQAEAATPNYAPNIPVYAMPFHLVGAYTTTITPVRFKIPYPARLIGLSASARSVSGTLTVDVQAAGVSQLSTTASITSAGVSVEGVVATTTIADEADVTIVLTPSGSGPTFSDVVVTPTFLRR